jgi:hypothetical protein
MGVGGLGRRRSFLGGAVVEGVVAVVEGEGSEGEGEGADGSFTSLVVCCDSSSRN